MLHQSFGVQTLKSPLQVPCTGNSHPFSQRREKIWLEYFTNTFVTCVIFSPLFAWLDQTRPPQTKGIHQGNDNTHSHIHHFAQAVAAAEAVEDRKEASKATTIAIELPRGHPTLVDKPRPTLHEDEDIQSDDKHIAERANRAMKRSYCYRAHQ